MRVGSLNISPAGRVVIFIIGIGSAWATTKAITRGYIRIGGVEHVRADGPVDFWFVVAVMVFLTALCFCAALLRRK